MGEWQIGGLRDWEIGSAVHGLTTNPPITNHPIIQSQIIQSPNPPIKNGWRRGRRKPEGLRRTKVPLARARRGEPATGPEPFADGGTAQTPQRRGAGAAGGIPTRTMRPHMRMNAQGYAGRKGGGGVAARRDTPTRFMPTVAENASASRATFAGMAGARGDRTRRQSPDCRAVRAQAPTAIPAQGARLGRSPPQIRGRLGDWRLRISRQCFRNGS